MPGCAGLRAEPGQSRDGQLDHRRRGCHGKHGRGRNRSTQPKGIQPRMGFGTPFAGPPRTRKNKVGLGRQKFLVATINHLIGAGPQTNSCSNRSSIATISSSAGREVGRHDRGGAKHYRRHVAVVVAKHGTRSGQDGKICLYSPEESVVGMHAASSGDQHLPSDGALLVFHRLQHFPHVHCV